MWFYPELNHRFWGVFNMNLGRNYIPIMYPNHLGRLIFTISLGFKEVISIVNGEYHFLNAVHTHIPYKEGPPEEKSGYVYKACLLAI